MGMDGGIKQKASWLRLRATMATLATGGSNSASNCNIRYYCYYWGDRILPLSNSNLELLLAISSYYSS